MKTLYTRLYPHKGDRYALIFYIQTHNHILRKNMFLRLKIGCIGSFKTLGYGLKMIIFLFHWNNLLERSFQINAFLMASSIIHRTFIEIDTSILYYWCNVYISYMIIFMKISFHKKVKITWYIRYIYLINIEKPRRARTFVRAIKIFTSTIYAWLKSKIYG